MAAGLLGGGNHFFFGDVRLAEAYIGSNRIVEQIYVLKYHRNIGRQIAAGKFPQIMSADGNIALLRVIKMSQQMQSVAGT